MGEWVVLYDADCGFCTWTLALLLRWDRERRLVALALQDARADELLGDLSADERMASWHLVSPSGMRTSAGAALPEALALLPGGRLPGAALRRAPRLTERGYAWVVANRTPLGRLVPAGAKRRARETVAARSR